MIAGKENFAAVLFLVAMGATSQVDQRRVYEGNIQYNRGRLAEAVINYREALEENPANRKANFNLGDAIYKSAMDVKSGKMPAAANATVTPDSIAGLMFDAAAEQFAVVANSVSDPDTLHRAWHNIGNCYLQKKDYRQAVEAYKKSLRFDPKDEETRYNLAYALKNLPPEDKGGGGSSRQNQQQKQQQQKQQPRQSEMSKEQADQLLKALMDAERKLQEKRKQKDDNPQRDVEKDW